MDDMIRSFGKNRYPAYLVTESGWVTTVPVPLRSVGRGKELFYLYTDHRVEGVEVFLDAALREVEWFGGREPGRFTGLLVRFAFKGDGSRPYAQLC